MPACQPTFSVSLNVSDEAGGMSSMCPLLYLHSLHSSHSVRDVRDVHCTDRPHAQHNPLRGVHVCAFVQCESVG